MAAMGPDGICAAAQQSMDNAHALAEAVCGIPGYQMRFKGPFFHEFVTTCPAHIETTLAALEKEGILGGLPLEAELSGCMLWCATEFNTSDEIDRAAAIMREVIV
jgi:glycine dehydrogenase subunit 1